MFSVPESFASKRKLCGNSYRPPRTETVTPPSGSPPAFFNARMASRAFWTEANGPSLLSAFGSASVPDQESFPLVATHSSVAATAREGANISIASRLQKLNLKSRGEIRGMSGS